MKSVSYSRLHTFLRKTCTLIAVTTVTATLGYASLAWAAPRLIHARDYIPNDAAVVERRGACLSPDEKVLYLTGLQDKAIYAFDVTSGEQIDTTSLAELSADSYGKAVAADANGDVWAPACSTLEIFRFDKALQYKSTISVDEVGASVVEGIVVGKDGSLYIPDRKNIGGIYKAKLSGDTAKLDMTFGLKGHADSGVEVRQPALGPDGAVYVGDFQGTTVYKVDGKTGKVSTLSNNVPKPYHITVDGSGRIYVAQYDAPTAITILSPDGKTLGTYTGAELGLQERSSGIAVDKAGKTLFVVDQKTSDYGGIVRSYAITF